MRTLDDLEEELESAPPGLEGLSSPNPKLRRDTLDAAIRRGDRTAAPAILRRLDREENEFVLSRALTALGVLGTGHPAVPDSIARFLGHADGRVVANALDALRALADAGHSSAAVALLDSPVPRVQANAIMFLAAVQPAFDPEPPLARMLASGDPRRQASALYAAAHLDPARVAGCLRLAAASRDAEVIDRLWTLADDLARRGFQEAQDLAADLASGRAVAAELIPVRVPALRKRVWAWLADSVVLALVAIAALFAVGMRAATRTPGAAPGGAEGAAAPFGRAPEVHGAVVASDVQLVLLAWSVVFFVRDGLGGGRGLGKRYMGLRVVDLETRTGCGYLKSMLRQATLYLPLLNVAEVAWAALDPEGRRIADRLLGTMVIDERQRDLTRPDRLLLPVLAAAFVLGVTLSALAALSARHGLGPAAGGGTIY
jgi:uncharacterized RDD family membrane protein YckC